MRTYPQKSTPSLQIVKVFVETYRGLTRKKKNPERKYSRLSKNPCATRSNVSRGSRCSNPNKRPSTRSRIWGVRGYIIIRRYNFSLREPAIAALSDSKQIQNPIRLPRKKTKFQIPTSHQGAYGLDPFFSKLKRKNAELAALP